MLKSKRKLITIIAITTCALALALSGCSSAKEGETERRADDTVESFDQLGLPSDLDELRQMLASANGAPLVKVDGQWMRFYAAGQCGANIALVCVKVGNAVAVLPLTHNNEHGIIAIMNDVEKDSDAYITYGDNSTYHYILHIPAETQE